MSFDYGIANDFDAAGDKSSAFGLAFVYQAARWLELYAGGKIHSLARSGANLDDVTIIAVGSRLKSSIDWRVLSAETPELNIERTAA